VFNLVFILFLNLVFKGVASPYLARAGDASKTTHSGLKDDTFRVERRHIPGIIHRYNAIKIDLSLLNTTTSVYNLSLQRQKPGQGKTMSNFLITKSNHLVEAGYKLSLNEQRLILSAMTRLDGRKPLPKDNNFIITAAEFAETFSIPLKQAYETLEDASSRLYERDIKTFDREQKIRGRFRWVDSVKYWDGEAKVTLSFCNHIIPYLTLLHQQFTTYELKQITQLKTAYAIRFYELLVQFLKTGERFISLEKLRELLELKTEYRRFFDFKKRIIDPAIVDINASTNLIVEWDVVKKGRAITGLIFVFQKTS